LKEGEGKSDMRSRDKELYYRCTETYLTLIFDSILNYKNDFREPRK